MNYDIFNCNWIATRWQLFSTHIHTNNTGNSTKQTIHRTTQKYIELSFYFTSHHITRHSTVLIPKLVSKIINPFTALKNISPIHFTSLFIFIYLFVYLSYQPYTSLHFAIPNYILLPFTIYLSPLLPPTGLHFPNPRFENVRSTMGSPYCPFR